MAPAGHSRKWIATLIVGAVAVAALALSACAPDVNASIISPQLGVQLAAQQAGQELVIAPTPVPPKLADLTPDQITAGLPDDLAQTLAAADASQGPTLAATKGCIGCHAVDPAVQMTGPTWYNVGDHAITRVPTESPAEYIHQSIINPNGFVVPNFPASIMPQNYGEQLSTQELADLIAYLLAQTGQP